MFSLQRPYVIDCSVSEEAAAGGGGAARAAGGEAAVRFPDLFSFFRRGLFAITVRHALSGAEKLRKEIKIKSNRNDLIFEVYFKSFNN